MFSIGEFSKLCQVSTKTLRHYDGIGLLKPAYLNEANGYRYYEASQLTDMLFILKLRRYGFSLEEIAPMMGADENELMIRFRMMLGEQKAEQKRTASVIEQIRNDITKLEKGLDIMENKLDIKIIERQPMDIFSVRDKIAISDFDKLFGRMYARMQQQGVQPAGAPLAIYHSADFDPEATDVEVGFPVMDKNAANHRMGGGKCAHAVHKGAYSKLNESYTALAKWVEDNGKQIASAPYEIYLNEPGKVPEEELVTEIYFPIK